jgi:hypothetical protein
MKKLCFILFTVHCSLFIFFGTLLTVQAQSQHTVASLLTIVKTAPDDTNKVNKTNEIYASRGLSSDTLQGNKWN